ncbi:MAG: hypothetical protein ACJA1Z_000944 [Patiriisocius sp.]|jgi:hypothetical protein
MGVINSPRTVPKNTPHNKIIGNRSIDHCGETPKKSKKPTKTKILIELLKINFKIPLTNKASFGKLILLIIPLAPRVVAMGEFIASIIIDHKMVPVKTKMGYGMPVSEMATVPELFKKIQTKPVVNGVINAQRIPK